MYAAAEAARNGSWVATAIAAVIPDRTSPEPAVARAGEPDELTLVSSPGAPTSVRAPFRSTTAFDRSTARRDRAEPIAFDVRGGHRKQTSHLPGVRREQEAPERAAQVAQTTRKMSERVGVDHDETVMAKNDVFDDRACPSVEPHARSDDDRVRVREMFVERRLEPCSVDPSRHLFEHAKVERVRDLRKRADRHEPGAGSKRAARDQERGARLAGGARNRDDPASRALVRGDMARQSHPATSGLMQDARTRADRRP